MITGKELYRLMAGRKRLQIWEVLMLLQVFMRDSGLHDWAFAIGVGDHVHTEDSRLLGFCDLKDRRIWITDWAVRHQTPAQLKDTILHEIAHALVFEPGHSKDWWDKAEQLGMRNSSMRDVILEASCDPADW